MHLYEAHLPVADTNAAQRFYIKIVGLQFAHHDLTARISAVVRDKSMLERCVTFSPEFAADTRLRKKLWRGKQPPLQS